MILENCKISGFADEIDAKADRQLEVLARLGISWIELRSADGINIADMTLEQARQLKEKLDAQGVRVSAIGSPIGKIGIEEEFAPHLEKLSHVADLAEIFECRQIRMFSFFMPEGKNPEDYQEQVFARMEKMVELAKSRNLLLLHENEKGIYGDNATRCLELMERFYGENFGCTFDFANFVQCRQDTLEAYEMLKPYISYVHIKDAKWESGEVTPAGEGDGHVGELLCALDKKGYNGFLSLEPHLFDFAGFQNLEREDVKKEKGDGSVAYETAYRALQKLLG